tara:strand:- start:7136 stop:7729 length:594 start_codon:yes stop_codon:yes gene_type:complete
MKTSNSQNKNYAIKYKSNHYISILSFITIFIVIIPITIYHSKFNYILLGYLPNVDLIATVLNNWGGPFNIWKNLYPSIVDTNSKFITSTIVNYFALLGLTYIVAKESSSKKNLFAGWSMAFIMCLMTYLLPSKLINYVMFNTLEKSNNIWLTLLSGIFTVIYIIILETTILKLFRSPIISFSKTIIDTPNYIKFLFK